MIRKIGDRLTLVGVAHILPESMEEVREVISEGEPEVVGVELCRGRYFQLTTDLEAEEGIRSLFSRVGLLARILRFFQEKMGQRTGMFPGEEMLTAVQEAQETGASVALIDRDINLTLRRLIDRMGFWEKLRILSEVLFSFLWTGRKIEFEDLTEEEVVEELISTLKDSSRTAYDVLIKERNEYMADRITDLLGSRGGKILCVVGAGHIPGLTEELESRLEGEVFEPWGSFQLEW